MQQLNSPSAWKKQFQPLYLCGKFWLAAPHKQKTSTAAGRGFRAHCVERLSTYTNVLSYTLLDAAWQLNADWLTNESETGENIQTFTFHCFKLSVSHHPSNNRTREAGIFLTMPWSNHRHSLHRLPTCYHHWAINFSWDDHIPALWHHIEPWGEKYKKNSHCQWCKAVWSLSLWLTGIIDSWDRLQPHHHHHH